MHMRAPTWTVGEFVTVLENHGLSHEAVSRLLSKGGVERTPDAAAIIRDGACAWHRDMPRSYETLLNADCKSYLRSSSRPRYICWKSDCQGAVI
jgi:hypothetical protein